MQILTSLKTQQQKKMFQGIVHSLQISTAHFPGLSTLKNCKQNQVGEGLGICTGLCITCLQTKTDAHPGEKLGYIIGLQQRIKTGKSLELVKEA